MRETLQFAALLRLDEKISYQERMRRANDVMTMLGLEEVADVVVGNHIRKVGTTVPSVPAAGRLAIRGQSIHLQNAAPPASQGISGGQARRLTIGVEIVQLPDVIFLDEPTTGLDSQISHEVRTSPKKERAAQAMHPPIGSVSR